MNKQGFTLAEILITLTIIGVVASLTLPALNTATGSAKNKTALKKTIANLNNAIRTNHALHEWNFANRSALCDSGSESIANGGSTYSFCAFINDNFIGATYLGTHETDATPAASLSATQYAFKSESQRKLAYSENGTTTSAIYSLPDGVILGFNNATTAANCKKSDFKSDNGCFGFIDVNGNAGPNEVISCETANQTKYVKGNGITYLKQACTIKKGTNADIFPIAFYDSSVIPATNAVYQYLNSNK